jgi:hypothetical protein
MEAKQLVKKNDNRELSSINETVMPEIVCKIGKPIEIPLRSIAASTGYMCALADKPDKIWLDGEATQFIPGHIPGQPGKIIFTFMGVAECKAEIVFKYIRPWDLNDIAEVVTFPIQCQK